MMNDNNIKLPGRFILHPDGDPLFNMASDEWLMGQMKGQGTSIDFIVKLYSWDRPAITFGYNQSFEKNIDRSLLDDGIPIIRRITGGRAIYHDPTELTLTVIINLSMLTPGERKISFTNRLISEIIVDALQNSGIHTNWAKKSDKNFVRSTGSKMKSCFDSVSQFEISSGLNKIAAGAQRIIGDILIHQGSLKLNGVTACAAVNQKRASFEKLFKWKKQPLTIADFSIPLFDAFGSKLGFNIKKDRFSLDEREEIDNYIVNFKEKILKKRQFN